MTKVAINGFGRIGRNTLRAAIREGIFNKIDYVAINDPGLKPEDAARLFKYESVMGKFDGTVEATEDGIIVNGKKILFFAEKDPAVFGSVYDLQWAAGVLFAGGYGGRRAVCRQLRPFGRLDLEPDLHLHDHALHRVFQRRAGLHRPAHRGESEG